MVRKIVRYTFLFCIAILSALLISYVIYEQTRPLTPLEFLEKNAASGDAVAMQKLGRRYYYGYKGRGVDVDYDKAIKWYTLAAENGNAAAQNKLGWLYLNEESGIQTDIEKSIHFYSLNAENGNAEVQEWLGRVYFYGLHDTPVNVDKGFYYFEQAAENNNARAQSKLGEIYLTGENNVAVDKEKGLDYYTKAADNGRVYAQEMLGWIYHQGKYDVPKDPEKSLYFYKMAAKQGSASAQYEAGSHYYRIKTPESFTQAAIWYEKAAKQGYKPSFFWLAHALKHKENPSKEDLIQSYAWNKVAMILLESKDLKDKRNKALYNTSLLLALDAAIDLKPDEMKRAATLSKQYIAQYGAEKEGED